ncbi:hypothetical protein Mal4_09880 [Maioricimonas rarisocia]|uniref:Uncharacterized protein n=1 Tax=Maioricimonas rarisocia TaxID=2528026 RepID=A0A517Z2K1_9PLAN|nr:hypothetical protein [Maioricimonas rarisocia]QDU36700.1 hypothetical protein Mal4_09880 [Maioricimonas rarisocia]
MRTSSFSAVFLSVASLGTLLSTANTSFGQQPPTLDEVIAALEERERLFFESGELKLDYERVESDDVVRSRASGGYLAARWTLARREDKWFLEQEFTQPGKQEEMTVPAKPRTQVYRDQRQVEWRQGVKSAFINEFGLGGNMYTGLEYTDFLGFDVPQRIAASGGADIQEVRETHRGYVDHPFLPEFLKENRSHYRVDPQPREVNGVQCWAIVWEGMDEILLDPELNFALRRRAVHWGPGEPMRYEVVCEDFDEAKPGLWLPQSIQVDTYASISAEDESLWGKVTNESTYQLHSAEFEDVPEDLFDLELPEGTRVVDVPRGVRYTVSAATASPFSAPAATEQVQKLPDPQERPLEAEPQQNLTLYAIGGLLAALAVVVLLRRVRS